MNEQLTPGMQRRVQALQRYLCAMEIGDVDTIGTLLSEAEHDHELERMILEVNEVYQHEDSTTAQPADVALVQRLLLTTVPAVRMEKIPMQSLDEKVTSPPLRKAPTQVLPAKKLAPRKWYRMRRNWIVATVAAMLIVLVLLPNSGAFANQLLSLFRIQHFQPVQVTEQDVKTLSSRPIPDVEDLGTVQIQPGSLQGHYNLTEAQAAQMVNFHLLLPHYLPSGIPNNPDFGVVDSGQATFTFSASKAHAYFLKNGYGDVKIPARLDGATFDITTSAGVVIAYGNETDTQFMVVEIPSPIVRATGRASLQELRDFLLSLPGLPPQLVMQLKQIDLNSGVFPLPVPSGVESESITVHGSSGLLLTSNISTTIEHIKKFPIGSMVVWQMHGVIYALGGTVSNTDQLLISANSLH